VGVMDLKQLDTIRAIRNVVRMIAITLAIAIVLALIFGCQHISEREMDEHFMRCIMINENEAFCS
jgi:hypothetical protein